MLTHCLLGITSVACDVLNVWLQHRRRRRRSLEVGVGPSVQGWARQKTNESCWVFLLNWSFFIYLNLRAKFSSCLCQDPCGRMVLHGSAVEGHGCAFSFSVASSGRQVPALVSTAEEAWSRRKGRAKRSYSDPQRKPDSLGPVRPASCRPGTSQAHSTWTQVFHSPMRCAWWSSTVFIGGKRRNRY